MPSLPRALAGLSVLGATTLLALADDPSPVVKKKSAEVPGAAEVRFADGSTVRMVLTQSTVDVVTRYGKLSVPVADVRKIEFGLRYPDGVQSRIDAEIHRLASDDAKARDAASRELLTFRELAYPGLKRATTGTDADLAKRATGVLKQLEEKVGADKARVRDQDTVHTSEFTVVGRIDAPAFKGRTTYFGEVTVQLAEVLTIRFLAGTAGEAELAIDAAKYAALTHDVWLDTEVDVAEGMPLEIVASGQVDLWPMGGNYKTGPDAQPRQGTSQDGNPSGMLLARIGEKGKTFPIGLKYSGSPSESGRLYLRIACSPWNNASSGTYVVKINPGADAVPAPRLVEQPFGPPPGPKAPPPIAK
ncbi:MAG TPA: hypothetical protein VKE40_08825 [Gemmataceae bacterium]|nr:hypothetical protein [Gemmataceae bacterium]